MIYVNLILVAVILLIVGVSVLLSLIRKLSKSRVRGCLLILSAILALATTALIRSDLVGNQLENTIIPIVERNIPEMMQFLELSETLNTVVLNCALSLVAPLLCLILYVVYAFLTWIVHLIVSIALRSKFRAHNQKAKLSLPRALVWGAVSGLITVFMIFLPISTYTEIAVPAAEGVLQTGALEGKTADLIETVIDDHVEPANNGVLKVYRTLGGKMASNLLTNFKVNGEKVHFAEEVDSLAALVGNAMTLTESPLAEYGAKEAAIFVAIADSFEGSTLLPAITGDLIYSATDQWLTGNEFLGMAKPSLGESGEMFDPFLNTLLEILHDDAKNNRALAADFRTVANLISLFAEKGVFAKLSNSDELMATLSDKALINSLVTEIGSNNSMKILIPEITNLGIRAIANALNVPADTQAVYTQMMEDVAASINSVKDLPVEERTEQLTAALKDAIDEAGITLVDGHDELIAGYVESISYDLIENTDKDTITAEDVQAFFAVYALNAVDGGALDIPTDVADKREKNVFAGTVYEYMTEDELKNCGAGILASALKQIVELDIADGEDFAAAAATVLETAYSAILAEDSAALNNIKSITVATKPAASTVTAAATLKSSETMQTTRVTVQDLLVDTKQVASNLTEETVATEAEAISTIFGSASDLLDKMSGNGEGEGLQISNVAESMGDILNSLSTSASVGSDKTAGLLTAVFQSETVREATGLDIKTATEMANAATNAPNGGEVDYKGTLVSVGGSIDAVMNLGKDGKELTVEEAVELIRNINPQTAAMIEIFVTADRLAGYGVPSDYSEISASLIGGIFHYMGNEQLDDYEAEANALNQILNIALTASDNTSTGKKYLYNNNTDGTVDPQAILPGNAADTVNTFMSSHAISYAIRDTMLDENGNVIEGRADVFGLAGKMNEESNDYQATIDAIEAYYAEHNDVETRDTLRALAALLGVEFTA